MGYPEIRPRRLRRTPAMRRLVGEVDLAPRRLVLPMFIREGLTEPRPISSLPGVVQHSRESLRKAAVEGGGGADGVRVRRALPYLDVLAAVASTVDVPVAAYQVSGEYAMVEAAAANGWLDRERVILETLTSIRRAGAQLTLTYWAVEAARLLSKI